MDGNLGMMTLAISRRASAAVTVVEVAAENGNPPSLVSVPLHAMATRRGSARGDRFDHRPRDAVALGRLVPPRLPQWHRPSALAVFPTGNKAQVRSGAVRGDRR